LSGLVTVTTDDERRTQLINKGLERAESFTWEKAAQKVYRILKDAANS